ncbi:MAG: tyrosine-type recombinase/integrase [Aggregatilineales bacterium]
MNRRSYWFAVRPEDTDHHHPVLVFDSQDHLHFHLTVFAKAAFDRMAKTTARVYLYAILPFFAFIDADEWQNRNNMSWDSPPHQVRQAVYDYLIQRLGCKLVEHRLGFQMVKPTESSRANPRMFLSGLKLFYKIMRQQSYYPYENPLVESISTVVMQVGQSLARDEIPRMPEISGVVEPHRGKRLTDSYFKLENEAWIPQVIDDPSLPRQVLEAGRQYGWHLREMCVVRILFESGARISEVLGLRLEDWVKRNALREANAFSKGSHGRRVKVIRFTSETAKLLRHYVDTERRELDPQGHSMEHYLQLVKSTKQERLTMPLFLSRRNTALSPRNFRDGYWKPACNAANLNVVPHQARHWYVTQMVREIYEKAGADNENVQAGLRALIDYMKWKSGWETLKAYDHYFDIDRHAELQDTLFARMYADVTHSQEHLLNRSTETVSPPEDIAFDFLRGLGGNTQDA